MKIIENKLSFEKMKKRSKTTRLILHHAEAKKCTVGDIHRWHKDRGWSGIGYHFLVRKNGKVYRGRPENTVGSHALNNNSDSIGICFEGSYMTETMPEKQKQAGKELVAYLKKKYGITKVQRHKDVCATSCPGTKFPFDEIAKAKEEAAPAKKPEATASGYYKKYTGGAEQIDTVLKAIGVPGAYRGSWKKRKALAKKNGIANYTGTAAQNTKLISLAKKGKVKKV